MTHEGKGTPHNSCHLSSLSRNLTTHHPGNLVPGEVREGYLSFTSQQAFASSSPLGLFKAKHTQQVPTYLHLHWNFTAHPGSVWNSLQDSYSLSDGTTHSLGSWVGQSHSLRGVLHGQALHALNCLTLEVSRGVLWFRAVLIDLSQRSLALAEQKCEEWRSQYEALKEDWKTLGTQYRELESQLHVLQSKLQVPGPGGRE